MKELRIILEDYVYEFYKKVGEEAEGRSPERVIEDALFKLAGELSLSALNSKNARGKISSYN